MKAKFEFDFSGEEGMDEKIDFDRMLKAGALFYAVNEFDIYLRGLLKYENQETIGTEEVRQKLNEYLLERGIVLEEYM